jgi:hypothetical protein
MDLGIARVAHACRENRRGGGRISCDGRTTRRVDKRKVRRVQERCRSRRASTTKDATALSAMLRGHILSARGDQGRGKEVGAHT